MTWIPVTERLPEHMKNMFVWTEDELLIVAHYNADYQTWFCDTDILFVTHWMELPQPPEGATP